jgi:hypothetical protein
MAGTARAMTLDGNGVALIIGAMVAGIVSLGTFAMTFINWMDGRAMKRSQARLETAGKEREGKIDALHSQVNGRLSELKIRISKEAFEMGRRFQVANGDAPSPEFPKPKVEEIMAQMRDAESKETIG